MGDVENFIESLRFFADMAQNVQRRNQLAVAGMKHGRYAVMGASALFSSELSILLMG